MRRFCFLPILAVPAALSAQAQAPVRYRMTSTSPNMSMPIGDVTSPRKMISINKGTSLVIMSRRDTVGGTIIELTIDSSSSHTELIDSSATAVERYNVSRDRMAQLAPAAPTGTAAARPVVPPMVHRIYLRNGVPFAIKSSRAETATAPTPLDSLHPFESLEAKIPGLALLVPNPGLPTNVGSANTNKYVSHSDGEARQAMVVMGGSGSGQSITLPPVVADDTTLTAWKRKSADTVEANFTRNSARRSTSSLSIGSATGSYRIVYDAKREVVEAWATTTNATTTAPVNAASLPTTSTSTSTYLLKRIP